MDSILALKVAEVVLENEVRIPDVVRSGLCEVVPLGNICGEISGDFPEGLFSSSFWKPVD